MKKSRIPGLSFKTPATGHVPVMLNEQQATAKDLQPRKSKRRSRRKGKANG